MSSIKTPVKNYKYSCGNSFLTNDQKQFYEERGYLVCRKLVNDDVLEECRKQFVHICNKTEATTSLVVRDKSLKAAGAQGEFLIHKIQYILYDTVFFKYASNKAIVDIVSDIIGPNITAVNSMLINKPPDAAVALSRHRLHQDLHYFSFRPANKIVAAWTAMEAINEINGCLFVIPGTHKGNLYPHRQRYESDILYHDVHGFDLLPPIKLPMEKGDTVFFHPLLLHGSGPNLSKGFRKSIVCHYADSSCSFINVQGTTQELVAKQFQANFAKRGVDLNFFNIWELKSRLIKGIPGKFQTSTSKL